MSYEIRALSVAEVLDQSFRLIRDRFMLLWGIAAIPYVPFSLVGEMIAPTVEPGAVPSESMLAISGIIFLVILLILPMAQLAITYAVSETYLGRDVTIGESYGIGRELYMRYLGTALLAALGCFVGAILFVFPGIYLAVIWMLAGPVVVAERISGPKALGRSRELLRDNRWRGAGVLLVSSLLFGVLGAGVQFMFQFIPFVGPVLVGGVNALAFAFSSCVLVIFYFELRCRHEDFDLQILGEQVAAGPTSRSTGVYARP